MREAGVCSEHAQSNNHSGRNRNDREFSRWARRCFFFTALGFQPLLLFARLARAFGRGSRFGATQGF